MKTEDFAYIVETEKNFDESVVSVLRAVEQKGWSLFNVYDIKERLRAKGFEQAPLKIIEICSGKYANNLLNKNKLVSLCMPCKINVVEDDGKVKIIGMKPTMMPEFFKEISKEDAEEVEKHIIDIINLALKY
ncbi:hypothetical protein COU56_03190 [Candidatus Pacearchaeota archaeon CG10_big_fil_rev_8_21_14_0_10_31_9]|nr:MAG: hypothetical protein AUJ62_02560 [Candidatus Pacearchaeota archaeon CG1_02_32_21]PIN94055.1 MAG: hypothetical protein COU56_03190 [Candidatus Pacearchaeota archaeon CG10_big_fil_rev_8_21_14_0_10_31_9]PIZ82492.1 MAG: hypothetical protein COX97_04560 [Candidatus Pacearchaeota archaeon CG_4_10_14_0_2_um_filter_05_32_18]